MGRFYDDLALLVENMTLYPLFFASKMQNYNLEHFHCNMSLVETFLDSVTN
jgi:hypothetical protein